MDATSSSKLRVRIIATAAVGACLFGLITFLVGYPFWLTHLSHKAEAWYLKHRPKVVDRYDIDVLRPGVFTVTFVIVESPEGQDHARIAVVCPAWGECQWGHYGSPP